MITPVKYEVSGSMTIPIYYGYLFGVSGDVYCQRAVTKVIADAYEDGFFLYGGIRLPDINTVWTDKTTYPYAVISTTASGYYSLSLCEGKYVYDGTYYECESEFTVDRYLCYDGDTSWSSDGGTAVAPTIALDILWSMYDVLDADGAVKVAASDPVAIANGTAEVTKMCQVGIIKREDATLYIKKVLGITGELQWAGEAYWNDVGDYDLTDPLTGLHYVMLNATSAGTYHITVPTLVDESDFSTENALLNGIQMSVEVPSPGIYMFEAPYEFTGSESIIGTRPYNQGPIATMPFGWGGPAQYKQVPATPGEYTDEGLYIVKIPHSQYGDTASSTLATDLQIYGKAPVGATEIHMSTYDGNLDKASLTASLLMTTTDIKDDRLFWHKQADVNLDGVINYSHESGYCAVVWCEAPAGGEFYAQATIHISCLSGDTLITLADGSTKRLDAMTVGEYVLSHDGTPTKVIGLDRGAWNDHHILYQFDNGTVIDETHEHRFFNVERDTLVKLKDWNIGEHTKTEDGSTTALVSVEVVNEPAEMFGMYTESGYYWANGLLSGEAVAAAKEPLSGDGLSEFVGSIPSGKLRNLIGDLGWFE